MTDWRRQRTAREARLAAGRAHAEGKVVAAARVVDLLEAVLRPGDRVCLEGDNQKQADGLARGLAACDPAKVHDLHMVQSGVVLPEHLDVFETGIARRLDYSYSGPQGGRIAKMLYGGQIELGAVHTYLELFARYFIDLTPNVALIAGVSADRAGNLYTGPNTEDTPTVVEATAFKNGVVIAQVNEIVDTVPRVDIPGDRIDFVVRADTPFYVEPLFTRDPAAVTETQILMAMMAIKGIYAAYGVRRLNHGIGFGTAAIELLLPTYAERLGLKGQHRHELGAEPASDPDPGDRVGLGRADPLLRLRGRHGSLHRGAAGCLLHRCRRLVAVEPRLLPDGRPLRMRPVHRLDPADRPSGPFLHRHHEPRRGLRRRAEHGLGPPWPAPPVRHLDEGRARGGRRRRPALMRGRKLVVQLVETFGDGLVPAFVERLDALDLAEKIGLELAPVMVYADDVTHIVTEEGIANLLLCRSADEREQAIRGVAGYTEVGRGRDKAKVEELRARGIVRRPEDLGIEPLDADRSLLAARSIKDLVHWSGGLYDPPARFRNW